MKKEKNFLKTLGKQLATFKIVFLLLFNISIAKADLILPNTNYEAFDVVQIQLLALKNNDKIYKNSGIEQTWNFAHPNNKKITGPLDRFTLMIQGEGYKMLLNHIEHTITLVQSGDNWAQFEVTVLDQSKTYHKFNWQVEKYEKTWSFERLLVDHRSVLTGVTWLLSLECYQQIQFCIRGDKNLVGIFE
jgi:hypothetical protein